MDDVRSKYYGYHQTYLIPALATPCLLPLGITFKRVHAHPSQ